MGLAGKEPDLRNGARWHHIASEAELKRAMNDTMLRIREVPFIGMTFCISPERLTIVRCSALGGDTRNIEGGWVYGNSITMMLDEQELVTLENNPMNRALS